MHGLFNKVLIINAYTSGRFLWKVVRQHRIMQHFLCYAGGALALRSITFVLTPLIMRTVDPFIYGLLALLVSFQQIGTAILGCGLRQLLSIDYFHGVQVDRQKLVNHVLTLYILIALPLSCCFMYSYSFINTYIFFGKASCSLIILSIIIIFCLFFAELLYQILQYERQAAYGTLLQITSAGITACMTIFLLRYQNWGMHGFLTAQLIGALYTILIGCLLYYKNRYHTYFQFKLPNDSFIVTLKRSIPFVFSTLGGWLLASGDRWILAQYASMHEVGIYATADLCSQLFYFFILYPWSGSYLPYIMQQYNQQKENLLAIEKFNQYVMYCALTCLFIVISIGYVLCKPIAYYVLPTNYHEAYDYVLFLAYGQIFLLGSYFASSFIQFQKKIFFLAGAFCIPVLLNITLNYLLIPFFGLYGCTGATLISYFIYFMITLLYNYYLQSWYKKREYHNEVVQNAHIYPSPSEL